MVSVRAKPHVFKVGEIRLRVLDPSRRLVFFDLVEYTVDRHVVISKLVDIQSLIVCFFLQDDQERLKEFLLNEDNAKHIDLNILIDEYYRLGTFFPYVKSLYKRTFYDPDIFAVIAGLLLADFIIWTEFRGD